MAILDVILILNFASTSSLAEETKTASHVLELTIVERGISGVLALGLGISLVQNRGRI